MEFIRHGRTHEKENARGKIHPAVYGRGALILAVALFILAACFDQSWAAHGEGGLDSRDKPALLAFDGNRRSGGLPADAGTGGNAASDNDATAVSTVASADLPPEVAELEPPFRWAGNGGFKLTVKGKNFGEGSKVFWNNASRETRYNGATKELVASMKYYDVLDPQTATVKVRNGDGQESNIVYYDVKEKGPAPVITVLEPSEAWAGSGGFDVTVRGRNFREDAVVEWDGQPRETWYIDSTELAATVESGDVTITMPGKTRESKTVGVRNGDGQHDSKGFMVRLRESPSIISGDSRHDSGESIPIISGLEPSEAWEGGDGFTLKVTGKNFERGSTVLWNSSPRGTQYIDEKNLTAYITESDIQTPDTVCVTVKNPDGVVSPCKVFEINPTGPYIDKITPSAVKMKARAGFTLRVKGKNFGEGSTIYWSGFPRATDYKERTGNLTTFVSAGEEEISFPRAIMVSVKNADGKESNHQTFFVMKAEGLEPPFPIVIPPPSRKITTTENVRVKGRYLSPITSVTIDRKDGGPCEIKPENFAHIDNSYVLFDMVMPYDTEGGEYVIRLHYDDEPEALEVPMTIIVARPPTPHP